MKRFLRSKLVPTLATVVIIAATIAIRLSGNITHSYAAPQTVSGQTRPITTISFGTSRAGPISADPNVGFVYAAQEDLNQIALIDVLNNQIAATAPTKGFHSGMDTNTLTHQVFVSQEFAQSVRIINGTTGEVVTDLAVPGGSPIGNLAVNSATNFLYVVRNNTNDIAVFNLASPTSPGTLSVGTFTSSIAVNPQTNRIYLANPLAATVTVVDGAKNEILTTFSVGHHPDKVAINKDTNRVYVADPQDNTVTVIDGNVIDASTNPILATISVGQAPDSLSINPKTNRIYVGNHGDSTLSVINGADNVNKAVTYPLTSQPSGIAVIPNTSQIYVASDNGHNVSVIEQVLWGFDSLSQITSSFYNTVTGQYYAGVPDFWGRYIGDNKTSFSQIGGCTQQKNFSTKNMKAKDIVLPTEAKTAHSYGLAILPIYANFPTKAVTSSTCGQNYAKAAIQFAQYFGISRGTAIFVNIEPSSEGAHPTLDFIKGWYDAFNTSFDYVSPYPGDTHKDYTAGDYKAGYYGDGTPGYYSDGRPKSEFAIAYCSAVNMEPEIGANSFIWSFRPQPGRTSETNAPTYMPPKRPKTPSCANQTVAWQYGVPPDNITPPQLDTDEVLAGLPLWYP